ncbi:unnamed protein product [Cunninghamella echinulata]
MIDSQLTQYPIPTLLSNDKPNSIPEFVRKLFSMLEENSYPSILTWGMKRDSFIILEPSEFSKYILPKQFKHSNFASFVRQLNKYDFHKIRGQASSKLYGNQTWEFKHIYFKYNRKDLLYKIKRKPTIKSNKTKIIKSNEGVNIENESSIIQKNIETLSQQLHDTQQSYLTLTSRLESMAENYQHAVETVVIFKKSLKAQDDFIQKMISTTVPTNEHMEQFKQTFQVLTKNENNKLTDIINHTKGSHQLLSSSYRNISHHHCNQFTIVPSHTKWAYSPRVFLIYVNHQFSSSQLCQWFQTIGCHVHLLVVNQEENDHIMLLKTGLLIKKSFDILFFMSKGLLHSKKINLLNTIRQKDSWLPIIDVDIIDHNNDWLKHGVTEMISTFYDKNQLCDLIHKYCSHLKLK